MGTLEDTAFWKKGSALNDNFDRGAEGGMIIECIASNSLLQS
jgi:hypothetical protein